VALVILIIGVRGMVRVHVETKGGSL